MGPAPSLVGPNWGMEMDKGGSAVGILYSQQVALEAQKPPWKPLQASVGQAKPGPCRGVGGHSGDL